MVKRLHALLFFLCLGSALSLSAQRTIKMGYCPDEISENAYVQQFNLQQSVSFQALIRIPAARLQAYKGSTIKAIRFASSAGLASVYVWIRPGFTEPAIGKLTRVGTTVEGWNETTLNTPYTITGDEILVGYSGTAPAGLGVYMDGKPNPNGCWLNNANSGWDDLSNYSDGSLCIQAVIETEQEGAVEDVAIEGCTFSTDYTKIGENAEASFLISNYGEATVSVPKLYYSLAGGAEVEVPTTGELEAGETKTFTAALPTDACTEGYNDLQVRIDAQDGFTDNNTLATRLACYTEAYPHKVLIEHFTTLPCPNCPYGLRTLSALVEGRSDYVWVAHHVGYNPDELTENASYELLPFGVSAAPMAMFDRRVLDCSARQNYPAAPIGYPQAAVGKAQLLPDYERCASTVSFVSVNIENDYDPETRTLNVTVSGERNALLNIFYPENNLTVELIENGVETKGQQVGSGDQIHSHVFRTNLTEMLGEPIEWDGDKYSRTFTCTLPETWNADNMRTVAFVNRPVSDNYTQGDVLNANEAPVTDTQSGIGGVEAGEAEVISRSYYDLQGRRLNGPAQGVYVEKVTTTRGTTTVKRVR